MVKNRYGLVFVLLVVLGVAPAFGYTVYLKDGSRLVAKSAPKIDGDQAIIVLQSGTTTSIAATEIDRERTRRANQSDYGTALVLEDGKLTDTPETKLPTRERKITDLAGRRKASPTRKRSKQRQPAVTSSAQTDLFSQVHSSYRGNLDLANEIQSVFRGQGVEEVGIYQGTQSNRILLEVTTNSESAVFRSLKVAAGAFRHVAGLYPDAVGAFELVMATSNRGRAGQFLLTPELADVLLSEGTDVSAFYVEHVQF